MCLISLTLFQRFSGRLLYLIHFSARRVLSKHPCSLLQHLLDHREKFPLAAESGSECCRMLRSGDWLEAGEREEQQTPPRAILKEQLERRAQGCLEKFLLETGLFHLVQSCKDTKGYPSAGHRPFPAKQGLCMLRSSRECYLGRFNGDLPSSL